MLVAIEKMKIKRVISFCNWGSMIPCFLGRCKSHIPESLCESKSEFLLN